VDVSFYSVSSNPPTKLSLTSGVESGANVAGNLIMVSVNAWPYNPIAPLLHSSEATGITVSSGDLIESSGSGQIPPPLWSK
jgi:hypothetical protein